MSDKKNPTMSSTTECFTTGCQRWTVNSSVCPTLSVTTRLQAEKGGWWFHSFLAECCWVFSCSINHQTWPGPIQWRGKTTEQAQSRCNHPESSARINTQDRPQLQDSDESVLWKTASWHLLICRSQHFLTSAVPTVLGLVINELCICSVWDYENLSCRWWGKSVHAVE